MTYYQAKVQFVVEDMDTGKVKKQNVLYLVNDTGITEAEAKITKLLVEEGENNFEVKSISESKISRVIS
jgi:hypothetical protein